MEDPKVTVSLITYNHARFIKQAIEGVLAQRTSFPFELVIGEDESSDGTREIVQRYAALHPGKIRVHLHTRSTNISHNGLPTGRHNFVNNLRSARGTYVSLLDGDDYFTDPEKLQRQADFLDAHPDCSTCFHRVETVDEEGRSMTVAPPPGEMQEQYSVSELLQRKFSAPTASVMFRRGLFPDFPEWYYRCAMGDFPLHVLNGLRGDFGFIDREMAAYRVHAGSRWSSLSDYATSPEARLQARARKLRQFDSIVELYEILAAANLGREHAHTLRDSTGYYRWQAVGVLREMEDWPRLRARLGELWLARPLPRGVGWSAFAHMLLKASIHPFRKGSSITMGPPS